MYRPITTVIHQFFIISVKFSEKNCIYDEAQDVEDSHVINNIDSLEVHHTLPHFCNMMQNV